MAENRQSKKKILSHLSSPSFLDILSASASARISAMHFCIFPLVSSSALASATIPTASVW
jgi:hypothetical protein